LRQGSPLFPLLFNTIFEFPCSNKTSARNKRDSNRKEEVNLSLFADAMILYLKHPKNFTKKLLEIVNTLAN
jgi:hypothetical protein